MLLGAGVTLLPILVTGGIHMDGFCDTCDALASHGDREKKLAIMKDSNAGAFAVLGCACYLLFYLALASQWHTGGTWAFLMGLAMVLERALAGLSLCLMPCARNSGLARIFADGAAKKNTGIFLAFVGNFLFLRTGLCGKDGGSSDGACRFPAVALVRRLGQKKSWGASQATFRAILSSFVKWVSWRCWCLPHWPFEKGEKT